MKKFENNTDLESYLSESGNSAPVNEVIASPNKAEYNFPIAGVTKKFHNIRKSDFDNAFSTTGTLIDFSDFELADLLKDPNALDSFNDKTIPADLFTDSGWSNLETINIPDEIETIEDGAFSNCTKLTRVVVGRGIKNMTAKAFEGCPLVELIIRSTDWDYKTNKFLGFPFLSYVRVGGHRLSAEELRVFTGRDGYGSNSGSSGGGYVEDEHFVVLRTQSDAGNKIMMEGTSKNGSALITGENSEVIITDILSSINDFSSDTPNTFFYVDSTAEVSSETRNSATVSNLNFVFLDNEEAGTIRLDLQYPYWVKFGFSCHSVIITGSSVSSGSARGLYLPFSININNTTLPSNVYIFDHNQSLTSLSSYQTSDPGARLSHLEYQPLILNNTASSTTTYMTLSPNTSSGLVANFQPTTEENKTCEYTFGSYSVYGSISPDSSYTGRPFVMTGPSQLIFGSYVLTSHYGGVYTNCPISGSSQSLNYYNNTWSW